MGDKEVKYIILLAIARIRMQWHKLIYMHPFFNIDHVAASNSATIYRIQCTFCKKIFFGVKDDTRTKNSPIPNVPDSGGQNSVITQFLTAKEREERDRA